MTESDGRSDNRSSDRLDDLDRLDATGGLIRPA
jgi:hypothetical protein